MASIELTPEDAGALRVLFIEGPLVTSAEPSKRLVDAKLAYFDPAQHSLLHISYQGREALRRWDASH